MALTRTKFYTFMGIACGVGYSWLYLNYTTYKQGSAFSMCIIKQATNIPCPSCGSTRAVESLLHGNLIDSLQWNPLGLVISAILIISPFWLTFDLVSRKGSMFHFFHKVEFTFNKKKYAIPALILLLLNWVWNIQKGL